MTVFKTFLKVLKACRVPIILYTVILICFGGFNMQTSDTAVSFVASKPDVLIISEEDNQGITKNLIEYIEANSNIKEIQDGEEAVNDALFYRDINYIIYIPAHFGQDLMAGKDPQIQVKSTGDYNASLAEMMLTEYIKTAKAYASELTAEAELVDKMNETLSKRATVEITSNLDSNALSKAAFYYNFANYSILAGCVYVICLILSSFREQKIYKRTMISSMNYKKYNRILLFANGLFALVLWGFYVLLSFVLVGKIMFTMHGLFYIINSLIFTLCGVTIAFLIGNLVNNKNALNGIVNVVALGSSFLCGAFVPMQWLPDFVIKIAHILPSYYYISSNELLTELENFSVGAMRPILINMGMLAVFMVIFTAAANIAARKKIG